MIQSHMLVDFLYFIIEREIIRRKKEAGEKGPWTEDKLLQTWRFCNVNRCHDRVTRWIFKHIVEKQADSPSLWFNLAIARFINWPPTLNRLGYFNQWDPSGFIRVMDDIMRSGEKAYTGAYMIRAGTGEDAVLSKHAYLVKRVFTPLWRAAAPSNHWECHQWDRFFGAIFGMGDFMRNQIITDLKYTKWLSHSVDWETFCLAGPGTNRGLNRMHDLPLKTSRTAKQANDMMLDLRAKCRAMKYTPTQPAKDILNIYFKDLNNLSNCLCEWDKYRRLTEGQGEPRSKYRPDSSPLP